MAKKENKKMRKKNKVQGAIPREQAERITVPDTESFRWLEEREIKHIISMLNEQGGATPQEAWELLTWANTVRIQHVFLELFMMGFVEAKIGDLPDPSSDSFREEWRIWSSVMVSLTKDVEIQKFANAFQTRTRKYRTAEMKVGPSGFDPFRNN